LSPIDVLIAQSAPMQAWLGWMFLVNFCSVFFLRRAQARWTAAAMVCNMVGMQALVRIYGTGHHLALPHVVFWSPLLVYLFMQRRRILEATPFGIWACLMFATNSVSLLLDYRAVFKWLAE
jgi:hypothetical protein